MQFKAFEPGIDVYGSSIDAIVEAFKLFPSIVMKRLVSHGIGEIKGRNEVQIQRDAWYSQASWLAAFENIAKTVGSRALFQIGQHVPKYAVFPPTVTDVHRGIASIDVAYHMNHRKAGQVMFDPATGHKIGGIGSYGYASDGPTARKIVSVCENPYPCDFDRGILTTIATRFERNARVAHDERSPCRNNGADSCTYVVSW